jgi:hypothetical protein
MKVKMMCEKSIMNYGLNSGAFNSAVDVFGEREGKSLAAIS